MVPSVACAQWVNNQPHGKGVMITPNVGVYTGDFVEGLRHGQGRVVYENGEVYEGGFEQNARHGPAVWTNAIGETFYGNYKDDEKDLSSWHGRVVYPNGTFKTCFVF